MKNDEEKDVSTVAVYAVPKKSPYVVRGKSADSVKKTLKSPSRQMRKAIKDSSDKLVERNIRKGWED